MNKEDLKERTKQFAIRITILVDDLKDTRTARMIAGQVLRSGTSVGANYRAACRAKSKRDFINKLKIVEEETDETIYWIELLEARELADQNTLRSLCEEGEQLLAIFVSSIRTAKDNMEVEKRGRRI